MRPILTYLVGAALSSAVACSELVLPTTTPTSKLDRSDLIPYRPLTRDDFKSATATARTEYEAIHTAALTCTEIIVRPGHVITRATNSPQGMVYTATIDDPIFFSVVNRKCSWWSPQNPRTVEDVLEHEQVHFAITELEARRLNTAADSIIQRVRKTGPDLDQVNQHAGSELTAILEAANEAALERHTLFDKQVFSAGRPQQRRWFDTVTGELEATRGFARGPQLALADAATAVVPATGSTVPTEPVGAQFEAWGAPVPESPPTTVPANSGSSVPTMSFPDH